MLDLAGYRNCRLQEDGTFLTEDGDLRADAFRYKVCDFTKASYVENEDGELTKNGRLKRHKVSVSCKIIIPTVRSAVLVIWLIWKARLPRQTVPSAKAASWGMPAAQVGGPW